MGEIEAGRAVSRAAVTVPDLLDRLEARYIENESQSIVDLKGKIAMLKVRFKGVRASEFGTDHIAGLKASMKRNKAANATVNRYLSALRRAFKLAERHDPPLVGRVPHFDMLPEDNTRSGFLNDTQYSELKSWMPEDLLGLLIFGYYLGMRKGALKNLRRDQVDLPNRVIRTDAPRRGPKPIGQVLPIYGDMVPWLEMQMSSWPLTPNCRWIFHREGAHIGDFRKAWASACKAAKVPDLLFHDLRRAAVRNMELAGIPRSQGMSITGHRTESIYIRYGIVCEQDLKATGDTMGRAREAGRQLSQQEGRKQ